jgi:hypothetical protein
MKNRRLLRIKHAKRRGECVELCFMARAAQEGVRVTKPYGETAHYDFAVEHDGEFFRVQVKSTMFREPGSKDGYSCMTRGARGPYKRDAFDFLAAYVIPEDVWYIIPGEELLGQTAMTVYPKAESSKYAPYKEAWNLLRHGGVVDDIRACTEEWAINLSG